MILNNPISPVKFAIIRVFSFQNNLKDLVPFYKTDLDVWDYYEREKLRLITEKSQPSGQPRVNG